MTVSEESRTKGFWFFKKTQTRYVVDVKVTDVYDFDEYRDDKSLGSYLNNIGFDLQKQGVIKPYSWDASYTFYTDWE